MERLRDKNAVLADQLAVEPYLAAAVLGPLDADLSLIHISIKPKSYIGRLSRAFPVTPPDMRVRIRRFGEALSG